MKVMWLASNDAHVCVLHWFRMREFLRDKHGVELHGPGYTWNDGEDFKYRVSVARIKPLSRLLRDGGNDYDAVVWDDACYAIPVPVEWDVRPECLVAWREHDYHVKTYQAIALARDPDIILGTGKRSTRPDVVDTFRDHPGWRLVPHPVDTINFFPGTEERTIPIALYGKVGRVYALRTLARYEVAKYPGAWLPVHGGYWKDGRGSSPGLTYYNRELADKLRTVKCLWVDGSDLDTAVMKFFEGAACGCLLVGKKPYAWTDYFPDECLIECKPEEIKDTVDWWCAHDKERKERTDLAWETVKAKHSAERRADQIMQILGAAV